MSAWDGTSRGSLTLDTGRVLLEPESLVVKIVRWFEGLFGEGDPLPERFRRVQEHGVTARDLINLQLPVATPTPDVDAMRDRMTEDGLIALLPDAERALGAWQPTGAGRYVKRNVLAAARGSGITTVAGAALAGLGALCGNAFPDFDIQMLGIGAHRNFAFHSALPVWGLYKLHKWVVHQIDPEPGSLADLACAGVGCFVGGFALGASAHLLIDATIQGAKAVIVPLLGSIVDGTLMDDRLWLGAGGLVSLYVAFREFEYVLGPDNPVIAACRPYARLGRMSAAGAFQALKVVFAQLRGAVAGMSPSLDARLL